MFALSVIRMTCLRKSSLSLRGESPVELMYLGLMMLKALGSFPTFKGLWLLLGRWRVGITQVSRSQEKGGVTWSPGCWAARRNEHEEGVRAKEGEGVSRSGLNSPGTLKVSNSKTCKEFEQQ